MVKIVDGDNLPEEERLAIVMEAMGVDRARAQRVLDRASPSYDVRAAGVPIRVPPLRSRRAMDVQLRSTVAAVPPRWTFLRWIGRGRVQVSLRDAPSSTAAG